jgi:hypothetical protein
LDLAFMLEHRCDVTIIVSFRAKLENNVARRYTGSSVQTGRTATETFMEKTVHFAVGLNWYWNIAIYF